MNGSKWVEREKPFLFLIAEQYGVSTQTDMTQISIRHMAPLPLHEQRHPFLRYQGLEYFDQDIVDFKERLERIHDRGTHRVQVLDFEGMPVLMRDVLYARIRMEHRDGDGVVVFTSHAWEVLLDLDAPSTIQFQLGGAKRRLSWREFILALGLHTGDEMESSGFTRYWSESERMIPRKGDLRDYWRDISTNGDFLGPPHSYTLIRDLVLRLCHRMMAHSIAGRSQAPKKVTVTDLFYLRGLDVGLVNIPYLLARYLRRFAAGRKSGALILGGVVEEAPVAPGGGDGDEEMPQAMPPPPRTQGEMIAQLEERCMGRCALHEIFRVTGRVPKMY
ncbi:hypothetical protein Tco_0589194 [Tanacetum coccineum]